MKKAVSLAAMLGLIAALTPRVFAADVATQRAVKQIGKPAVISVFTRTERVRVLAVDQTKRTVKLRTSDGDLGIYKAGKDVRNLGQLKQGDVLTATETERFVIYVRQSSEQPSASESFTLALAPKGAKPGLVATEKVRLTGKVQMVDYRKRTVTITGPAGKTRVFDVARDVKNLEEVRPGDQAVVDYTDTLSIVTTAQAK